MYCWEGGILVEGVNCWIDELLEFELEDEAVVDVASLLAVDCGN